MLAIDFFTFRPIADGMLMTMIVIGLLLFSLKRQKYYLLYSLFLTTILVGYQAADNSYKLGNYSVVDNWEAEIEGAAAMLYAFVIASLFQVHLKTSYFKKTYMGLVIFLSIIILIEIIEKINHHKSHLLALYILEDFVSVPLFCLILYKIYQLKFKFFKYFFFGSICVLIGAITKMFFQMNDTILVHKVANAFSFENTYNEISFILEAVFIFMGISAFNTKIVQDKVIIQEQLLNSLSKKSHQQTLFYELQDSLIEQLNQEVANTINQISELNKKSILLLKTGKDDTRQNLNAMFKLGRDAAQNLKKILREFDGQSFSIPSIEVKANRISLLQLQKKMISFDLHLNDSRFWLVLPEKDEKEILTIYENLLIAFATFKKIDDIIIHFSFAEDAIFRLIMQDNGERFISKDGFERKLNLLEYQIQTMGGTFQYLIEDTLHTSVRVDLPTNANSQTAIHYEHELS